MKRRYVIPVLAILAVAVIVSAKKETGLVEITSDPEGAFIFLDSFGNQKGKTPKTLEVEPGEHKIILRKAGYRGWEKGISLNPGQVEIITVTLSRKAGGSTTTIKAEDTVFYNPIVHQEDEQTTTTATTRSSTTTTLKKRGNEPLKASDFFDRIISGKKVRDEVREKVGKTQAGEKVRVTVNLKSEDEVNKEITRIFSQEKKVRQKRMEILAAKKNSYRKAQEKVISRLDMEKIELKHRHTYSNAITVMIDEEGLAELESDPDVESIILDRRINKTMDESGPMINATHMWQTRIEGVNVTGLGQTICVIDTGIDYDRVDLGGPGFPNEKVIAGYDFCAGSDAYSAGEDGDPMDMDDVTHGTNVGATAASNNASHKGIAPEAKIVALKVFDDSGNGCWFSDVSQAIDYCIANQSSLNISVITMSLGSPSYSTCSESSCESYYTPVTSSVDNAWNAGIFVSAASGNEMDTSGITFPACLDTSVSVGGVYDLSTSVCWNAGCCDYGTDIDDVMCITNRCSILDVMAPGYAISAGGVTLGGTSMAAPHVAGAGALLNHYANLLNSSNLEPAQIRQALIETGENVTRDGTYPRIKIYEAARYLNFIPPRVTGSVDENSGNTSTDFTFTATYTDDENHPPQSISVNIDGTEYAMTASTPADNDYTDGKDYELTTTLSQGTHSYNITASDGGYGNSSTLQQDAITINSQPTLTSGSVSPGFGSSGDTFTLQVTYTDADGDQPEFIKASIDGSEYDMSYSSGSVDTGADYTLSQALTGRGTKTYSFRAGDGNYSSTSSTYSNLVLTTDSDCESSTPPYESDWDISSSETCNDTAFLASNTGNLNIAAGKVLTLKNAATYLNGTRLVLNDNTRLELDGGEVTFI